MENIPQQNDLKPEEILNPKQPEMLNVSFEYQNDMGNALFEKAVRPKLSAEEISIYDEIATEKYDTPDSFLAKIIMWAHPPHKEEESTPEMIAEQAKDAERYASKEKPASDVVEEGEEKNAVSKKFSQEQLDSRMSVISHTVELMKEYLLKPENKKIRALALTGVVASELAGCAGMPMYTAGNMIQTGLYGVQSSTQAGMSGYGQARMQEMSGNMQAGQTAQAGSFQAQYTYDSAMQRAGQNRINAYNSLGRQATPEESARIEAQYQNEVNSASIQARQIAQNTQMEARRIQGNTQIEAQRIGMNTQIEQYRIGMNVTGEIVRQAIGGIIQGTMHGGWHR